jgi:hypothetical protein
MHLVITSGGYCDAFHQVSLFTAYPGFLDMLLAVRSGGRISSINVSTPGGAGLISQRAATTSQCPDRDVSARWGGGPELEHCGDDREFAAEHDEISARLLVLCSEEQ